MLRQKLQFLLKSQLNTCLFCQAKPQHPDLGLCLACEAQLPHTTNSCQRCGTELTINLAACGRCLENSSIMDKTVVALRYQDSAQQLLTQFKFHQHLPSGTILARMLAKKIQASYINQFLPEIIIPTPIHTKRLRERGFNQSYFISQQLARVLNLPIDQTILTRIKNSRPQSSVDAKDRKKNVRGAFSLQKHSYQHIAIVDDVITTGNTISELCQLVRSETQVKIHVWACCKTRPKRQ